jgi:hypothetical protein
MFPTIGAQHSGESACGKPIKSFFVCHSVSTVCVKILDLEQSCETIPFVILNLIQDPGSLGLHDGPGFRVKHGMTSVLKG